MIGLTQWLASAPDVPRIERDLLLCEYLGITRAQIIAHPELQLSDAVLSRLQRAVEQLREGTPLAYILGHREFWGLTFTVTPDVLIPRPETELLVEIAAELSPPGARVLDLGTGSGAIAIALASERPDLQVHATDRSVAAIAVARSNARRHCATIEFHCGDWYEACPADQQFDLIISNPPYIAADDLHLLALAAEPQQALVADLNGLADLAHIIAGAPAFLHHHGTLAVEHGHDQAHAVREIFAAHNFSNIVSRNDLASIERVTMGQWSAHSQQAASEPFAAEPV